MKNRLHLEVSPIDGSTEDEVTRLLGLDATKTDVGQGLNQNWEVMADPRAQPSRCREDLIVCHVGDVVVGSGQHQTPLVPVLKS